MENFRNMFTVTANAKIEVVMVLLWSAFQLSSAVYEKFENLVRVRKKNEVRRGK